jgi:hypothetical protein
LWEKNPQALRWCAVFPEHQGHVHWLKYSSVEENGRDVLFYDDDKNLIAAVVPFEESTLDLEEACSGPIKLDS